MNKIQTYYIHNKTDDERYYKTFDTYKECFWWVVDNLDLSKRWETSIRRNTLYSRIEEGLKYLPYFKR
tara:strand:+ start:128 stop:331 length:204 start_codon:yes stop_codon:yes gene_type:complete